MAVRQYVGARYVPQIMGDWNDQTVYEPLSVVTYNFGSYTSKKAVPAGVEPTNEEYWALTGQYNAQVEEYRQTVDNYAEKVNKLIKGDINQHVYLFIGDSYAAGDYGNITEPFYNIIVRQCGIENYKILGVSGMGFNNNATVTFQNAFTNFVNANKKFIKTVTDVVIVMGANDINKSGLASDITNGLNLVKSNIPGASIILGFCGVAYGTFNATANMRNTKNIYIATALENGVKIITDCEQSFLTNSQIMADMVHPTQAGQSQLALYVQSRLFSQPLVLEKNLKLELRLAEGVSGTVNLTQAIQGEWGAISGDININFTEQRGSLTVGTFILGGYYSFNGGIVINASSSFNNYMAVVSSNKLMLFLNETVSNIRGNIYLNRY